MERLKCILLPDGETVRVWMAAGLATGVRLSDVNTALTTAILLGTLIYTWRKALHRRRKNEREERED